MRDDRPLIQTRDDLLELIAHALRLQLSYLSKDQALAVADRIAFTSAFTDLRTGIPCRDRVGVLSVRIGRWFEREDTTAQTFSMVVEAQRTLPMAKFWGAGVTSSSDGQHFTAGGMGDAMNAVNAWFCLPKQQDARIG